MTEKIKDIKFALKDQEYNPKIKEGELVGIAIQTWNNYVWSNCGYLMVPNDPEAIQKLEKKKLSQESFFLLEAKMRVEEIKKGEIFYEGEKPSLIGKKKVYVEDPDWGKKFKLIYAHVMKCFVPTKVVKNENNLLHIEIEPMRFYDYGRLTLIDKLIFKGEKINQYRDLITGNLGKEFKTNLGIFADPKLPIDTDKWGKYEKIELAGEKKTNDRPEVPISKIKQSLEKYYQKNDIKMMKLSDEDKEFLDIVFNDGQKKSSRDFLASYDRQKFEQTKIYLQSNGKQTLEYSELTSTKISDPELDKQKKILKKWMEQENIEEIILKRRNVVLCKKCNGSGSLYFGSEPVGSNEIPQELRTKINGVDIGLFFEKIGKNSISRQELGADRQEKREQINKGNFDWITWIISGTLIVSSVIFIWLVFWQKQRRRKIKYE